MSIVWRQRYGVFRNQNGVQGVTDANAVLLFLLSTDRYVIPGRAFPDSTCIRKLFISPRENNMLVVNELGYQWYKLWVVKCMVRC